MDKFRMDKRIELEARGRKPQEITDLNLDNCRSTTIIGLTDEYIKLEVLSLINVNLTSLKGFPKLPNLKKLELSDNRISNGLNLLAMSPKLTYLNLSNNRIKEFENLEPLKELTKLKNLDLFNNEVNTVENYRSRVFELIPSLKYLDGFDIKDNEAEDSDDDDRNGNEESGSDDEEDEGLSLSFSSVGFEDRPAEKRQTPLPVLMYTLYGFMFHLGTILGLSGEYDDDDDDLSLSAVYNDNLGEESSENEFAVSDKDEEDEEETVDEEEGVVNAAEGNADEPNPESDEARGKKRKHEGEENE